MKNNIEIIGLKGFPLIHPGDVLSSLILRAVKENGVHLEDGDVVLIAQTIVSKSIGRLRNLKKIRPSSKAIEICNQIKTKLENKNMPKKSPEHIQAILDESEEILKIEHVLITETKHGFVCANAGIDKSNVEGDDNIALLPQNPDEEARKIALALKKE
ncbi:MAG: coenzyme F420-0:L-glutamate ligase, partial [Promethearchaeota archaeon]